MSKSKIPLLSFLHAFGVVAYVSLVATIMQNGEKIFGKMSNLFGPVAFLLMFVLSAAVTGGLVLGRSVLWYWDGKKQEAVKFFFYVIGWLFVFTLIAFGVQIIR